MEEKACLFGLDPERNYDLLLAVTELITNSIEHGYQCQSGYLEIEIERSARTISVLIRDNAPQFDPRVVPPPDLSLPLEKRSYGGLGIFLTLDAVDGFDYKPLAEGGNQVKIMFNCCEE